MNKNRKSKNLIGATGEYYVCAELGKRGILALLTPKNNPLFDIVAISEDASKTVAIQVKTMSIGNNQGWKLGMEITKPSTNPNLYVILVNLRSDNISYYIYDYDTLNNKINALYREYLNTPKKDGNIRKDVKFRWLDFKYFEKEDYDRENNWNLLGFDI